MSEKIGCVQHDCAECRARERQVMKCDYEHVGWINGCTSPPKWWFREGQQRPWHARCGMHAKLPGNTKRERVPIVEGKPTEFEPLLEAGDK